MKGKISASMMCADLDKIFNYLEDFEKEKLEYLHIDVMDGNFVPNLALGTDYVKSLRKATNIPFDYHFLVNNPLEIMKWFDIKEGDQVAFHYEGNSNIKECIDYLKSLNVKIFIAINPDTDYKVLDNYIDLIDGILVMTVYPGFAGKSLVPSTIKKVENMTQYYKELSKNIILEVDGNMSVENAKIFYNAGATIFVAGSSSLFKKDEKTTIEKIKEKRAVIGWN